MDRDDPLEDDLPARQAGRHQGASRATPRLASASQRVRASTPPRLWQVVVSASGLLSYEDQLDGDGDADDSGVLALPLPPANPHPRPDPTPNPNSNSHPSPNPNQLALPLPPPGFEMVDARLLRREASLLLSDGAARASTMVVHPHAAALDGLTAGSAKAKAAFEAEAEEEGGGSGGAVVPLDDAALDALADATMADRARNRWLEKVHPSPSPNPKVVPSFEVHPAPSPNPLTLALTLR